MEAQVSEAVRAYQLNAHRWKNRSYVVHKIRDPGVHPSAPPRSVVWKSDRTPIGKGGSGKVFLQTCIDGGTGNVTRRAVKSIPYEDEGGKQRYWRELETLVRFSHESVRPSLQLPDMPLNMLTHENETVRQLLRPDARLV